MSYCVNCGVELHETAVRCPLCNQKVYHPEYIPSENAVPPFPKEKEQVEKIMRKDLGILFSIVFLATGITCGALNFFTFSDSLWSLSVIGACGVLWVMMIPAVIYTRFPYYLYFIFDGAAVALYLFMLAHIADRFKWLYELGVPITVLVTVLSMLLAFCVKNLPRSFLTVGLYTVTAIALLCAGIEILVDRFKDQPVHLSWSALVLTVGVIIDIAIITMLSLRRVRNEVRKRLHF